MNLADRFQEVYAKHWYLMKYVIRARTRTMTDMYFDGNLPDLRAADMYTTTMKLRALAARREL